MQNSETIRQEKGPRIRRLATLWLGAAAALGLVGEAIAQVPPLLTTFGAAGGSGDALTHPHGVAVGSNGDVYVTDKDAGRVQVFDADGTFRFTFGSSGSGAGEFSSPHGVAVDTQGDVYVADAGNYRIQKFDASGNYLTQWGSFGSASGQFHYPFGVDTDAADNVYVTCSINQRVQKFDSNGTFLMKWGTSGSGPGQFFLPYDIAVDASGNVFVVEGLNYRVQKFGPNGAFLGMWGSRGSGDGQFDHPYGIETDAVGDVYVVDSYNHRVQKFDSNGVFLGKWGMNGAGVSAFQYPTHISIAGGRFYIADHDNRRINLYGTAPFTLAGDREQLTYQDAVVLRTFAGCASGLALLFVVDVNGIPTYVPLYSRALDPNGLWDLRTTNRDPSLVGITLSLRTFSRDCNGSVIATPAAVLSFD